MVNPSVTSRTGSVGDPREQLDYKGFYTHRPLTRVVSPPGIVEDDPFRSVGTPKYVSKLHQRTGGSHERIPNVRNPSPRRLRVRITLIPTTTLQNGRRTRSTIPLPQNVLDTETGRFAPPSTTYLRHKTSYVRIPTFVSGPAVPDFRTNSTVV